MIVVSVSPTESQILAALRTFLLGVLPTVAPPNAWDVVLGQDNKVPEPGTANFVEMWPIMRPRLATDVETAIDTAFQGAIAGAGMIVSSLQQGFIKVGATVFGVGVAAGTTVTSQTSGSPGGAGTYVVAPSQAVSAGLLASGEFDLEQETEIVVQLDVHSADLRAAGDVAATISTTFRSSYATGVFAGLNPAISPLYNDDPRQTPFINAESQYESRWSIDVHLQANQVVSGFPQQFADAVSVDVVSVDATYPP